MALPLLSMVLAQPWWMPHCGSGLLPQHNTELLEALRLPPLKLVRRVAELSLYHSRSCLLQLTASLQGLAELSKLGCWAPGQTMRLHELTTRWATSEHHMAAPPLRLLWCRGSNHLLLEMQSADMARPACRHCTTRLLSCKTCSGGPQTGGCRTVWPRRSGSLAFRASPLSTCRLRVTLLLPHDLLPSDQQCVLSHSGS